MNLPEFPKRQLLILIGVCTVALILAIIVGFANKNSGGSRNYVIEDEVVTE